jgi:hypothetical protein
MKTWVVSSYRLRINSKIILTMLDLVTRVLYRLRFLSEQRPLDAVSLAYCFPLLFLVLEKGGIGKSAAEEADEQLILAIEVLTFHTNSCKLLKVHR